MSNNFSKKEEVLFDELLPMFKDNLVLSSNVNVADFSSVEMERSGNVIYRPMPYIGRTYSGSDQTANFKGYTQLSVPATLGFRKVAPLVLTSEELRDKNQLDRIAKAGARKLASDINISVMNVAAQQGTLVVASSTAAGSASFGNIAACDTLMNEIGVQRHDRCIALSSAVYNGLSATVPALNTISVLTADKAFEKAQIPYVADFKTLKLDYANTIAAAAGSSLTIDTQASASNYYVPVSTQTAPTGERSNVDNRYQTITISSTTGVVAGDRFTIAGIQAVNLETKSSTGNLKTFTVIENLSSTTLKISPPIISNQGGSTAEIEYQNCTAASTSATAAIVFLNANAAPANPFWFKDAIELIPGTLGSDSKAVAEMRSRTENGIELRMVKFYDIDADVFKYRLDVLYGVCMVQPEMAGILLMGQ